MHGADIGLIVTELALSVILYILAGIAGQVLSTKWKLCYALPFVVGMVYTGLYGADICLIGVYLAVFLELFGFLRETEKLQKIVTIVSVFSVLGSVLLCKYSPGYRSANYAAEFDKAFNTMERFYVLTDHKEIDWEKLYQEYYPRFTAAHRAHDAVENCIAWKDFCGEFHDGHVEYLPKDENVERQARERMFGNDYGLALMTLENGVTVAVNVERGSVPEQAGICNGTVVTAWNQEPIETMKAQTDRTVGTFPDWENEDFYSALPVAGMGGEEAEIRWLDSAGAEQTTLAPRIGFYQKRLEDTLDILDQGIAAGNLAWTEWDADTWCLRIKSMMYDSESYNNGDHRQMQGELREKLLELRESGVSRLVLDLRGNSGGSGQFDMAIVSLFAPLGEHYTTFDGVWDEQEKKFMRDEGTGRYVVGHGMCYQGEDLWEGREIILLVNAMTVSAGDMFVQMMEDFDNVTVMGFTRSNSSCQAVRGIGLSEGYVSFSAVPTLKEDGSIFVDTDSSRQSTINLDVKIPFDEQAVKALFDRGEDYVLEWALRF